MANIMISERELAKLENHVTKQDSMISRLKKSSIAQDSVAVGIGLLEAAGAAGVTGFMRGHFEKNGKTFAVGPVDIELGMGVGLLGLSFWRKGVGKYAGDVRMAGFGILSHYTGQLGRAIGKGTPITSTVIGMLPDHVGWGPTFGPKFVGANDLESALRQAAG